MWNERLIGRTNERSRMEEALSLDLNVLKALVYRNRNSHGRTQYYKRISMAIRCLERNFFRIEQSLQALRVSLIKEHCQQRLQQKQEWTMEDINKASLHRRQVKKDVQLIQNVLEDGVPEVLSRIVYASEALFGEVERGFFLPLCIVALGALARIRIIVVKISLIAVNDVQSLTMTYKDELESLLTPTWIDTIRNQFIRENRENPPSNEDLEARTWKCLGLTRSLRLIDGNDPLESVEKEATERENDSPIEKDDETPGTRAPTEAKQDDDDDDDDVGESILHTVIQTERQTDASSQAKNVAVSRLDNDDSDRNLELVESVKAAKKVSCKKRAASSADSTEKKKKKKKKRRRMESKTKKDIFDEIFGD